MDYDLQLGEYFDILIGERRCASNLQEITPAGTMILSAPTFRSTPLPIEKGRRVTLVYYRPSGMYSCTVEITRRFVENKLPFVEAELRSPVQKYQRRDFVRFETMLPVSMALIAGGDKVRASSVKDILRSVYDFRCVGMPRPGLSAPVSGMTMDISGGGARISSDAEFGQDALVECTFTLDDDSQITVDTQILRCNKMTDGHKKFQLSTSFVEIEEKIRQKIIKYIFDEQIKRRRK